MNNFYQEVKERVLSNSKNERLKSDAATFMRTSIASRYSYNFSWLGRPIIQYPQDIVAMQELIWHVKPDFIIETGIAHGGSLIFSATMLALLDLCDAAEKGVHLDPGQAKRKVLGIDIDIRAHNLVAIEAHPMASRIQMIQGSSIAPEIVERVRQEAGHYQRVLVCLDSNHTHDHVLQELRAYAPLATRDSYCVVFDTVIDDLPKEMYLDRAWGPGNSPKSAVREFLAGNDDFVVDEALDARLLITVAPGGYLRRVR